MTSNQDMAFSLLIIFALTYSFMDSGIRYNQQSKNWAAFILIYITVFHLTGVYIDQHIAVRILMPLIPVLLAVVIGIKCENLYKKHCKEQAAEYYKNIQISNS